MFNLRILRNYQLYLKSPMCIKVWDTLTVDLHHVTTEVKASIETPMLILTVVHLNGIWTE